MEPESETPSREDLPDVESPMPITTKYQNLIHARDWAGISKMDHYDKMTAPDQTAIIIGMAKAQQFFDETYLKTYLKDAIKNPSKYNNPVTILKQAKEFHEASTATFDLISSMLSCRKGNN
jgi:hypothetical protein